MAGLASARINTFKPAGQIGSSNQYVVEAMLDGNGFAAQEVKVYFTAAFSATKAQRNSAGAAALIAHGAAMTPPYTLTVADIGPD